MPALHSNSKGPFGGWEKAFWISSGILYKPFPNPTSQVYSYLPILQDDLCQMPVGHNKHLFNANALRSYNTLVVWQTLCKTVEYCSHHIEVLPTSYYFCMQRLWPVIVTAPLEFLTVPMSRNLSMNASCTFCLWDCFAGAEPERPVLAHDPTRAQHVHRVRVAGGFRFLRLRLRRQSKQ
jgi:hypothetical protein